MSWRNRTIKILSKKEIDSRYPKESNSNVAKLTRAFIENGCKIAYLKMDGLGRKTPSWRHIEISNAIEIALKNDNFEIRCYTDLSELKEDAIYVAFKVLGVPKNYYH